MKKFGGLFLLFSLVLLVLSGCNNSEPYQLNFDENNHWYENSTGIKDKESHKWDSGVETKKPTCSKPGEVLYTCTVCEMTKKEFGTTLSHNHVEYGIEEYATLEKAGSKIMICEDCDDTIFKEYSVENSVSEGIESINILCGDVNYNLKALYETDYILFVLSADNFINLSKLNLYYKLNGATELIAGESYLLSVNFNSGNYTNYTVGEYRNLNYDTKISRNVEVNKVDNEIYIKLNLTANSFDVGKLAFFPEITVSSKNYSYAQNHPYMLSKYAETWLCLNSKNNIYYDTYYYDYVNRYEGAWTKPSFKNHDSMFVGVIKEPTVEGAIVAMAIAESKGAMGFDLHLNYLYNNGLLTVDNIKKISHSSQLPILALNYNGSLSQIDRLDGLLIGVDGGCAAVDFQGFMYWSGSTINTQTAANKKYWEEQGFDMSFVSASPKETVIDPATVEMQKEYAELIHSKGAEILMSAHIGVTFTRQQALAFAEFNAAKGMDIVKIVGIGNNKQDVIECVEACKLFTESNKIKQYNTKVSFHLSGDAGVYITRVLCTSFYNSYIAFCYPELTEGQDGNQLDLDMAVECYNIAKNANVDNTITIEDAIAILKAECDHSQLIKLVEAFEKYDIVELGPKGFAYGAASDMSDRWNFDGNKYYIELRNATGTNNFNIRSYAYDNSYYSSDLYISSTIQGSFSPYTSSERCPKVGLYIGDENKMLAFVYNTKSKTIDLVKLNDGEQFKFDDPKGDRLFSTGLIENTSYQTDVENGGTIKMAIHKTATSIKLYFSEGNNELQLVTEIALTSDILSYFTNDNGKCYGGVLSELYMGSASKGKVNDITFNVLYNVN